MASIAELKKDFTNLIKADKLSHGYLLYGFGAAEDKISFTQELANYIENGKWGSSEAPLLDATIIGGGIDDIRAGIHFLWQKPFKSTKKTLIIPDGENLTPEAQNAILKIAEEAPSHALIILLVKNPETILPTLRSRFQKIYIHNANDTDKNANDANKAAKEFLKSPAGKRKEIIKNIIAAEDDKILEDFVTGLIAELSRDKIKNWRVIKELLHRWSMINMYNVNKRLQLETALLQVKSL